MAYTALQLITRAYYVSQVVAPNLQTVSGFQVDAGLYLLNAFLDFKSTDLRHIPYFNRDTFNTVAQQEMYVVPNLLYVDVITFNIGPVRYAMQERTREEYFGTYRVDTVYTLPTTYRVERVLDNMNIYMYPVPADVYVVNYSGKFGLTAVTLNEDLSLIYDPYYIEYMRYALGEMISAEFGCTFPDASAKKLAEYEKKMLDVSPPDLAIRKSSYFGSNNALDWQSVNLYKGWWP